MRNIPVSGAEILPEDIEAVIEVVKRGWFTEGEKAKEFADALKKYIGTRHASLCNSGSSANLLAITALKDKYRMTPTDKVVTCATGFPTTITPIVQNGIVPLFVDANPHTLNPNLDTVLHALEREDVIGVVLAHTLGFPFDAKAIREECDELGKFFVEDCADALGTEIYGQKVGTFGHASTFSFFPAHHITCGEGGAVLTDDGKLLKLINSYRDWGRDCYCLPGQSDTCNQRFEHKWRNLPEEWDHKYTFTHLGYNLKITEMQATLGLSQLKRINFITLGRMSNYWYIRDNFHNEELLQFPIDWIPKTRSWSFIDGMEWKFRGPHGLSPFGLPISVVSEEFTKQELVLYLEERGIHTRPVFAGNIVRHPMAEKFYYEQIGLLEGSDFIMNNTFWIGVQPSLTKEDLDYVVEIFYEFFKEKGLV